MAGNPSPEDASTEGEGDPRVKPADQLGAEASAQPPPTAAESDPTDDVRAVLKDPDNPGRTADSDEDFKVEVPTPAGPVSFWATLHPGSAAHAAAILLLATATSALWIFASGYAAGRIVDLPWLLAVVVTFTPPLVITLGACVWVRRVFWPGKSARSTST